MKTVSLIIPAYNEEEAIPHFLERIVPLLDAEPYTFEMIFIDDGSKDRTLEILLEARRKDPRIRIIELARNFGKELAVTAGFHAASGDAVVPMDVDLQDPPDCFRTFSASGGKAMTSCSASAGSGSRTRCSSASRPVFSIRYSIYCAESGLFPMPATTA